MEPVGVYKILLNQCVHRFITLFIALLKIFHYLLSFQQAVLLTSTKLVTKRKRMLLTLYK
nr:MAG TPA: hypothetical protein [Bacteriophage sp.]